MTTHVIGIDLGQANDFTAVCILAQTWEPNPVLDGYQLAHYAVVHLDRMRQTPYPEVVQRVSDLVRLPQMQQPLLAIDATGVGRPVTDLFIAAGLPCSVLPVTITGGVSVTRDMAGGCCVPKRDLCMGLLALMQAGRLKIGDVPLRDELDEELQAFRVKVNANAHETFEALRERDHDDLVMSLALAAWAGQNRQPGYEGPLLCSEAGPALPEIKAPTNWREAVVDLGIALDEDWEDQNDPWRR
jgi:hypothetical protein